MKVAMLAPIAWRTPPRHYGPWELVTSLLTEGLVARGVEVTLFATLDSQTSAVLRGVSPRGYAEDASMDGRVWEALHVATALSASTDFDLLHNQMDWLPLALSDLCHAPMLTTVHGFSGAGILPAYVRASSSYVAISEADRSPELEYLATIYHGIDFTVLPFQPTAGDGLGELRANPPGQGDSRGDRYRQCERAKAGHLRHCSGRSLLRRASGTAHRRRSSHLFGPGRLG